MKKSTQVFLAIALAMLTSVYIIITTVSYEKDIEKLNEEIFHLKDEVQTLYVDLEFDHSYITELESQLDSIHARFMIFDSPPGRDVIDILNAIVQVESGGDPSAHAKGEDAVGILQIRKCMVDDVNRILERQGISKRFTYIDRWDIIKSYEMFNIFCDYYGLTTAEEMARCWNGGPRGINNPATLGYWDKVENILDINS
tara:strand:+ start:2388 stop:2984 length:597 start_codon:yes stop_codon:yes gene_type:complete